MNFYSRHIQNKSGSSPYTTISIMNDIFLGNKSNNEVFGLKILNSSLNKEDYL